MAHAGEDPPEQPASGQIGTLPPQEPWVRAADTGGGFPGAGPAGVTALPRPAPAPAAPGPGTGRGTPGRWFTRRPLTAHLVLLAGYVITGLAVTWPRVTYLAGRLPALRDAGGYVWDFWWVARQVSHLSSPWSTRYLAAPVGSDLGYHTLMPLPGLLMTPITWPWPSLNLQPALRPVPRAAVLPDVPGGPALAATQLGAITAGGFWPVRHPHLAQLVQAEPGARGAVPADGPEAAVRLTRRPGGGRRPSSAP